MRLKPAASRDEKLVVTVRGSIIQLNHILHRVY